MLDSYGSGLKVETLACLHRGYQTEKFRERLERK
jgi:hypothetical protein